MCRWRTFKLNTCWWSSGETRRFWNVIEARGKEKGVAVETSDLQPCVYLRTSPPTFSSFSCSIEKVLTIRATFEVASPFFPSHCKVPLSLSLSLSLVFSRIHRVCLIGWFICKHSILNFGCPFWIWFESLNLGVLVVPHCWKSMVFGAKLWDFHLGFWMGLCSFEKGLCALGRMGVFEWLLFFFFSFFYLWSLFFPPDVSGFGDIIVA